MSVYIYIYIYIKSAVIYVCSKSASFSSALKKKKDPSHHYLYQNTLEPIICELHDHENRTNLSNLKSEPRFDIPMRKHVDCVRPLCF